jgi:hypothetical protein
VYRPYRKHGGYRIHRACGTSGRARRRGRDRMHRPRRTHRAFRMHRPHRKHRTFGMHRPHRKHRAFRKHRVFRVHRPHRKHRPYGTTGS